MATPNATARRSMLPHQKGALFLIVAVLVASVAARMLLHDPAVPAPNAMPEGARSFAAQTAADHPEGTAWTERVLPVVTEASLFGLIGFALGYSTRKAFQLVLILIAVAFVAVQVLVARGTIAVDWGGVASAVQGWVLNLEADVPIVDFLKTRIPTAIAFVACYVLGFRRG